MPFAIETLNENQRRAVLWANGPVLVLAGPGSGKTRVLTWRVVRLLEEMEDSSVLALTFTNKAAGEMRERVDQMLGHRAHRSHLCTFHSYATDVLRQHGSHLGINPDFSLVTLDEDRLAILGDIATRLSEEGYPILKDRKSLLGLLDRLFAESYNGESAAPSLTNTPAWVPLLFAAYCEALVAANRLDYGSLLYFACRLLREKPAVARLLRLGWTHVCVDEFQDTNRAQYDLLRLIVSGTHPNLFVVGDEDQIVYQWNGASPERLQAIRADYEMEVIQLPENYRCPPQIVDLANRLISHNRMRTMDKAPIVPFRVTSVNNDVVRYRAYASPTEEAAGIAKDILSRPISPAECVVLARTTKLLESIADALRTTGLEVYVVRRKTDFQSPVVRVMYNALHLANARHDRDILRRLCLAWEALSNVTLVAEDVAASATLIGGDFLRAWVDAAAPKADDFTNNVLGEFRSGLVDRLDFPGILERFLAEAWSTWADKDDSEFQAEMETWRELHAEIAREYANPALNSYLQQMDLMPKSARPGPNAIKCMTVHAAKGLEFKHVYLAGLAQDVLPSFQALKMGPSSRELEEERRNCFVAVTRVQETLTLTRARQYNGWQKAPSQFLVEMGISIGQ